MLLPSCCFRAEAGALPGGRRKATTIFHRFSAFDHFPIATTCMPHLHPLRPQQRQAACQAAIATGQAPAHPPAHLLYKDERRILYLSPDSASAPLVAIGGWPGQGRNGGCWNSSASSRWCAAPGALPLAGVSPPPLGSCPCAVTLRDLSPVRAARREPGAARAADAPPPQAGSLRHAHQRELVLVARGRRVVGRRRPQPERRRSP